MNHKPRKIFHGGISDAALNGPGRRGNIIRVSEALPFEINPHDVHRRIQNGENIALIDVREPNEYEQARIEGAKLIPMRTVPAQLQDLEALADNATLVVYCHHGVRSLQVVNWLREQGIAPSQSMSGGIDRWSREVDPNVPRYF
jgi:rhodanese-related sulfurtransferase